MYLSYFDISVSTTTIERSFLAIQIINGQKNGQ